MKRKRPPGSDKDTQSSGDYEVGYGRPPVAGQFPKGVSGNPKGRPKGSKSTLALMHLIGEEKIWVNEGGTARKMPRREVIIRRQFEKATAGDPKAAAIVLQYCDKAIASSQVKPTRKILVQFVKAQDFKQSGADSPRPTISQDPPLTSPSKPKR